MEDGGASAGAGQGEGEERRFHPRSSDRWSAKVEGFNVHAGVRVAASEDEARERLCRYSARPTLALSRLSLLPGGNIAYRVKNPQGPNSTHRVMTPLEFMARIAALVPPPRYPLVRYHGVLAPNSPWRRSVVPRPPDPPRRCGHTSLRHSREEPSSLMHGTPQAPLSSALESTRHPLPALYRIPEGVADGTETGFDRIAPSHWKRLDEGALLARSPHLDWATLFRRTFLSDPLACDRCGGRMRPVEMVTDPDMARKILERLGMPSDPPEPSPPRDPDEMCTGPPENESQLCFDDCQPAPEDDYSQ